MNLRTLPGRYFLPVGYRKDGRPIFPVAGGSEPPKTDPPKTDPPKTDPPKTDPPAGPVEAKDENGVALGFPEKTPVEQMNSDQKAAYWRNETKKANKRVPSNLDELQTAAQKWAEHQRAQLPEEQRRAAEREEQIRNEAATQARREAAQESAAALLRVTLSTRGKTDAEMDEILEPIDPAKFLTQDGKLDTGKVTAFVDKLAPARSGGGGYGQGRYENTGTSKRELGESEAKRRFGNQQNDPNRGTLGGLRR